MAIDRNKIAQQAERLVAQGKVLEAIAQYEILVKDNARDMNTINKIGDLYSRLGKKREAILQFNKIGEFYAKDGFFLKAIAIYKKITKLDATHLDAYQRLADLYAQQGLVLEARSQYQMVAEQYLKEGDIRKAVSAYQSLVRVDPENLKHRGHLADLLAKDGRAVEAAEEYTRLGAELERKGREPEARAIYQKASAVQPGAPGVVARLANARAASGDLDGAIKMVTDGLAKTGDHKDLLALLGDLQLKAQRYDAAEDALRRAIQVSPDRPDLTLRLARAQAEKGDADGAYQSLAPHLAALIKQGHAHESTALLERIVQSDRGHVDALMRLAESYAAQKKEPDFNRCAQQALDLCIERNEYAQGRRCAAALLKLRPDDTLLRDKLALLHSAEATGTARAAAPPPGMPAPTASASAPAEVSTVLELPAQQVLEPEDEDFITEHMTEADVFVKYGLSDRAVEQLAAVIERFPAHVPAISKLKEIHLEEGNREAAREQMSQLVKAHLSAGDEEAARQSLEELRHFDPASREAIELSAAISGVPAEAVVSQMPQMAQAAAAGGAASREEAIHLSEEDHEEETIVVENEGEESEDGAPTSDELKEVDAFLAGGERDGAVAVLRRLAGFYGSHPDIVSRMKAAVALPAATPAKASRTSAASHAAPAPRQRPAPREDAPAAAPVVPAHQAVPPEAAASSDLSDLSDLASEIDAALMAQEGPDASLLDGVEATPEGHSLDEIVAAFKKGIEQQIGSEDYDTHYNLGIAYKEMGLMDEAIGEFQFAAKDPRLLVDCCSMLGICFHEKGMSPLAVKWYRRGLEAGDSSSRDEETLLGLRYDLAELLVEMGEHRQAMELFTEVFGINSKYRDVAARIKELERQNPSA